MNRGEKIRERIARFLGDIKAVPGEPDGETVVVVARADGYDFSLDREVWRTEDDRNEARDLRCRNCEHQVVMSNGLFRRLTEGKFAAKQVICGVCVLEMTNLL